MTVCVVLQSHMDVCVTCVKVCELHPRHVEQLERRDPASQTSSGIVSDPKILPDPVSRYVLTQRQQNANLATVFSPDHSLNSANGSHRLAKCGSMYQPSAWAGSVHVPQVPHLRKRRARTEQSPWSGGVRGFRWGDGVISTTGFISHRPETLSRLQPERHAATKGSRWNQTASDLMLLNTSLYNSAVEFCVLIGQRMLFPSFALMRSL